MPISPWQYYVRLKRKKASRTTQGRTLRPRVIKLSGGAAAVNTRARPDTPERCYGEKCFSAFLLHPSGSSKLKSAENAEHASDWQHLELIFSHVCVLHFHY